MSLSAIPSALRRDVMARDQGRCRYCGLSQVGQGAVFHVDHVVPKSRGGATEINNLALQCPHCSLYKSNGVDGVDPISEARVRLFHPLRDRWDEHFEIGGDGRCEGKTEVGRATVMTLEMNAELPRVAREIQVELGLISLGRGR